MFDFGFTELLLVALVALIVVGPERLPKVARTAGHLLGRLQRYVSDVKSDISREMQLEDLKKLQKQVEQQARELETSVRGEMNKVESDLGNTMSTLEKDLAGAKSKAAEIKQVGEAPASVREARPPMPNTSQATSGATDESLGTGGRSAGNDSGPQLELGLGADKPREAADKS